MNFFWQGLLIGFAIAAPVGPIGVLCIRRTLANGRLSGFISGLGAATADGTYGLIAGLGLTLLANFLVEQQTWLRLVGGAFLIYLGLKTFFEKASPGAANPAPTHSASGSLLKDYVSTFVLTLTNPLTILSFGAIFAGLGLASSGADPQRALWLVAGVFSGSAAWWFLLSGFAAALGKRFLQPGALRWVNLLSGVVILAFGVLALGSAVVGLVLQANDENVQARLQAPPINMDASGFTRADGSYSLSFPRDHGPHPDFQTEWWYYTGNLQAPDGRHFGFQLTFFRRAIQSPDQVAAWPSDRSDWATSQVYMAHFALSDVGANRFYAFERRARGAAGLAGAQAEPFEVWLDEWQVQEIAPQTYRLYAAQDALVLDLTLSDLKGPILQGQQGYSRKGPQPGQASYYYSFTRLQAEGTVQVAGRQYPVQGLSWMDHEFSTSVLSADQIGWDWFSMQFDDGSELMLFELRKEDGSIDPFSSGTWIAADGSTVAISRDDFELQVLDTWSSPHSGAVYPSRWLLRIPSLGLEVTITPYLADQELDLSYAYWEGCVSVQGSRAGQALQGSGYVEMTGYSASMAGDF
jgi:predicted secreted hydrolase